MQHVMISWPKGAAASDAEQLDAAVSLLKDLGLADWVSHADRHPHVHVELAARRACRSRGEERAVAAERRRTGLSAARPSTAVNALSKRR